MAVYFMIHPIARSSSSRGGGELQTLNLTMRQGQSRLDARALRATWAIPGVAYR